MASDSNKSVYHGVTPPKPGHRISEYPPTPHAVDQQSLRDYRLESYRNGLDSVPLANPHATASSITTQTTRQAELTANLNNILSRIG
ncbi:hypothetical protein F5Y13DRAFT_175246 [Hypoxylon sp. FL1857]|nr:hypothetical protein F5Y13DRAFT_175246 [Hypoxylon sp. FL1857]